MMAGTNNSVGASLRAITQSGKQYNVISVKVNNQNVSPPNSDDDEVNNTNNLYDDVEMGGNGKICVCLFGDLEKGTRWRWVTSSIVMLAVGGGDIISIFYLHFSKSNIPFTSC